MKALTVGLPYIGSKKKIAGQIVRYFKQSYPEHGVVYDLFGGGGSVSAQSLLQGLNVRYNDKDPKVTQMFHHALTLEKDQLPDLVLTREQFQATKSLSQKTPAQNLALLLLNSFACDMTSYLYAQPKSDPKYRLTKQILQQHGLPSQYRYKATPEYRSACQKALSGKVTPPNRPESLTHLERLIQLERLTQLRPHLDKLTLTTKDYRAYSHLKGQLLYLDPPYENTKNPYLEPFDHEAFYDWAHEMSKQNTVLISSYHISDPRFYPVLHFKSAKRTLNPATATHHEKLYAAKQEKI